MSENITIDEDDGIAIITRRLVRDHPLLQDRIWYKTRQLLPNRDDNGIDSNACFTTLEAVYNCNMTIAAIRNDFPKNWEKVRPELEELDKLHEECKEFWDGFLEIDAVSTVTSGSKEVIDFRPISEERRGEGHLLFRPIGQETWASAVSAIMKDSSSNLKDVTQICRLGSRIDWRLSSPPWVGLFFGEGGRMLGSRARQSVGERLMRFMLGVPWPEQDGLLKEYREMVYPTDPDSPEALTLSLPPKVPED